MADVLKEALRLRAIGFAVHWLRVGEKIPVASGWPGAPIMSEAELRASYRTGYNLGFRPGRWSMVAGKEICVLDVDVRGGARFAQEAYAAAATSVGGTLAPHVISGSGVGRHQYLGFAPGTSPEKAATTLRQSDVYTLPDGTICQADAPGAKPAWVVELLSTGKQVVLPPSIHPDTNKPYKWA